MKVRKDLVCSSWRVCRGITWDSLGAHGNMLRARVMFVETLRGTQEEQYLLDSQDRD